jgi:integrase
LCSTSPGAIDELSSVSRQLWNVPGFFTRDEVEQVADRLPSPHADLIRFLFWSAWRVGETRRLEWRHYFRDEAVIRLPAELSKNKQPRAIPLIGELATVLERRWRARRLECPRIFHDDGDPIGDFRKRWATACTAVGLAGRLVHDLRRSGVKHLIDSGVDPHTAMAFSGHRTPSMLRRYHIIDLDDLREAAERASDFRGIPRRVTTLHGEQPQFSPRSQKSSASAGHRS